MAGVFGILGHQLINTRRNAKSHLIRWLFDGLRQVAASEAVVELAAQHTPEVPQAASFRLLRQRWQSINAVCCFSALLLARDGRLQVGHDTWV